MSGLQTLLPLKTRNEQTKKKRIPSVVNLYLDVWNTADLRKHKDPSTKAFNQAVTDLKKLIKGSLFNNVPGFEKYSDQPFTLGDFKKAVARFEKSVHDSNTPPYSLSSKKKLRKFSLSQFLLNPEAPLEIASSFITCLNSEERTITVRPVIANTLGAVISGPTYVLPSSPLKAITGEASSRIQKFFDDKKDKIPDYSYYLGTERKKADMVLQAIESSGIKKEDIHPKLFCSDWLYEKALPTHLRKIGLLR